VTNYPEGSVLPSFESDRFLVLVTNTISEPTPVEFSDGQTQATYNLTSTLMFEPESAIAGAKHEV
jgi:hypothetical protein